MEPLQHSIRPLSGRWACAGPQTSRSGQIHTVKIEKEPEPAELVVNIGDEVRWVNHRSLPVRLELVGGEQDLLSCERGFSNFLGMKRESATIDPNESVAACFNRVGVINYNLRMDSALPGGRAITSGTVQVGDPTRRLTPRHSFSFCLGERWASRPAGPEIIERREASRGVLSRLGVGCAAQSSKM